MNKYISSDELKEYIGPCPENWCDTDEEVQAVLDWKYTMSAIDAVPEADVVNIEAAINQARAFWMKMDGDDAMQALIDWLRSVRETRAVEGEEGEE